MDAGGLEKTIEKKTETEGKSTKVRVNTSTHCHQFSLLQPVVLVKAVRKRQIRKASMKTSLE